MTEEAKKTCFVVMPIGSRKKGVPERESYDYWKSVFDDVIRPAVENSSGNIKCIRADHESRPGIIDEDIIEGIHDLFLCVADVTGKNANVYYELGMRDVWHDRTILITQSFDDVVFDKGHNRALLYNPKDLSAQRQFDKQMKNAIDDILANPKKTRNPVRRHVADRSQVVRRGIAKRLSKRAKAKHTPVAPLTHSEFHWRLENVISSLGFDVDHRADYRDYWCYNLVYRGNLELLYLFRDTYLEGKEDDIKEALKWRIEYDESMFETNSDTDETCVCHFMFAHCGSLSKRSETAVCLNEYFRALPMRFITGDVWLWDIPELESIEKSIRSN